MFAAVFELRHLALWLPAQTCVVTSDQLRQRLPFCIVALGRVEMVGCAVAEEIWLDCRPGASGWQIRRGTAG